VFSGRRHAEDYVVSTALDLSDRTVAEAQVPCPAAPVRRALGQAFESLLVIPVFLILRQFHLAGHAPLWLLLATAALGAVPGSEDLQRALGGPRLDRRLHLRLAAHILIATAAVYLIGWGPVMAPAYAVVLAQHLKWGAPARVWRPMLAWSLAGVAAGQLAVQAGWIYSYIPVPRAHGLAMCSTVTLVMVMRLLGMTSEAREREARERERQEAERARAEDALRDSERRFRALVQNSTDVVIVTDTRGVPTYVSPSSERVTGYPPSALLGIEPRDLIHPDDIGTVDAALATVLAQPGGESRLELRYQHADGAWHWHEAVVRNLVDEPAVGGMVVNYRDVTERRALEEQLRHQAFHDPLTGLANRALFMDRLEHALARQQRSGAPPVVMLIDLDDFKSVNDSLGHLTGDRLILEAARALRTSVRPEDTVARLGGDEFALLLEGLSTVVDVRASADRVLSAVKRDYNLGDHLLPVTASIGVAVGTTQTADPEELVRNADVAMYVAKGDGKGRFAIFEPGMHLAVHERLQLKADLTQALAAGDQMDLDYQPIVELDTGRTVSVEALVRWNHPTRGRVAPGDFIPLAEDTGLIVPLGRWVLAEACRQLAAWRDQHDNLRDLSVSVNLSAAQLGGPSLVDDVHHALLATGLDPSALVLEITETALVRDMPLAERVLRELKDLGVRVAIDDFGTGYSSLRYLQRFPLDLIKIDRCFVSGLGTDPNQALIAETIIKLGRSLNLATVAEGVEEADEAEVLRGLSCQYAQGFLFARPAGPTTIEGLLATVPPVASTEQQAVAEHELAVPDWELSSSSFLAEVISGSDLTSG
jgi:diguanylate cyclase (GGDEF)-like protein/PAS domain S-box-containing protein